MARYNEILVGHVNRGLQKHLQMKGEPPAPQLSSEIQASLALFSGNENRYLFGWNLLSIGMSATGGGAQLAGARLRNPGGSNGIAVIHGILIASGTTQGFALGLGPVTGDLTTPLTAQRLDARKGQSGIPGFCIPSTSTNTGGAFSPQIGTFTVLASTPVQLILFEAQEIPLLPGEAIEVDPLTVATAINVWFLWRERFLEESERA